MPLRIKRLEEPSENVELANVGWYFKGSLSSWPSNIFNSQWPKMNFVVWIIIIAHYHCALSNLRNNLENVEFANVGR